MRVLKEIEKYIENLPEVKRADMHTIHNIILAIMPACKLWFLDGKDSKGKIVSNPNIGYGSYNIHYSKGTIKEFYQIGLSANTTGISVYILGIKDKKYLAETYSKTIGKASVTGYCIKFKSVKDINADVLKTAIQFGINNTSLFQPMDSHN